MDTAGPWGAWDDSEPYFIAATCSLDKARQELQDLMDGMDNHDVVVVPVYPHAVVRIMHDCDYESCYDKNCPHKRAVTVYEFRLEDALGEVE